MRIQREPINTNLADVWEAALAAESDLKVEVAVHIRDDLLAVLAACHRAPFWRQALGRVESHEEADVHIEDQHLARTRVAGRGTLGARRGALEATRSLTRARVVRFDWRDGLRWHAHAARSMKRSRVVWGAPPRVVLAHLIGLVSHVHRHPATRHRRERQVSLPAGSERTRERVWRGGCGPKAPSPAS